MFRSQRFRIQAGFTLIELSIVLIIIGLLVGGIIAGRELIAVVKLRVITQEWQGYQTAIMTYKLTYDAVPGDHNNAVAVLGASANGNGNNVVENAVDMPVSSEPWYFWEHLALAGFIEGAYTGVGGVGTANAMIGTNVPESDYRDGTGWSIRWRAPGNVSLPSSGLTPQGSYLVFGDDSTYSTFSAVLPSNTVQKLDDKFDDGLANNGRVRVYVATAFLNSAGSTVGAAPNYVYSGTADFASAMFEVGL